MNSVKLFPLEIFLIISFFLLTTTVSGTEKKEKNFDKIKERFDTEGSSSLKDKLNNGVSSLNNDSNREEISNIDRNQNNKKRNKTRRSCCGENDDLKLLWGEGVRDLKKECYDQARRATQIRNKEARMEVEEYEGFIRGNRTKDEYICTVQCIGQKKEVLDHMGNVKKDEMWEYVKETYSSEPWKSDIADKLLDKCYRETQKPSEGEVTTDNGSVTNGRSVQAKCNSNGISFIHCLWREMQLNCPADKLRDNRKCNRLRERLRTQESSIKNGTARSLF